MYTKRCHKLRNLLRKNKIDALLLSNPFNLQYLLGFGPRGCMALVSATAEILFSGPALHYEEARVKLKVPEVEILTEENFFKLIRTKKFKKIAFEPKSTSFFRFQVLNKKLKGIKLIPQEDLVESLRIVKEPEELKLIKKAARVIDEIWREMKRYIKPGFTEIEVANKIENLIRMTGANKAAFDLVVAGGPNSAFPHHGAGSRKFLNGDIIILDLGVNYQGYCSDLTRTVVAGKYKKLNEKIEISYPLVYAAVLAAQKEAIKIIRPGVKCSEVDKAAREIIRKAGLEKFFIHSTGHGLGLEVHERPYLNKKSKDTLKENMVITIEPGIYIPGWGGVRIEDMVLVTRTGYEILTQAPK